MQGQRLDPLGCSCSSLVRCRCLSLPIGLLPNLLALVMSQPHVQNACQPSPTSYPLFTLVGWWVGTGTSNNRLFSPSFLLHHILKSHKNPFFFPKGLSILISQEQENTLLPPNSYFTIPPNQHPKPWTCSRTSPAAAATITTKKASSSSKASSRTQAAAEAS